MDRTCTLCNFTTSSDFRWESHLARDSHRLAQLKNHKDRLLIFAHDMLRYVNAGTIETEEDRKFVSERAREVIDLAEGEEE